MPFTWQFDEVTGVLTLIGSGPVTDEEYLAVNAEIFARGASGPGPFRSVADFSEVTDPRITPRAIRASVGMAGDHVRDGLGPPPGPPPAPSAAAPDHRIAIVATRPAIFGLSRMWQTLVAEAGVRCEIFGTREAALAWLDS